MPRQGYIKLLTVPLPSASTGGYGYYNSNGTKRLLYAAGQNLYVYNNSGGSSSVNALAFNPSGQYDFDEYLNVAYGVNGNDFIAYNGSAGSLSPNGAAALAQNGGVNVTFSNPTALRVHKNRVWIASGSNIYFSDAGVPTSFPAFNIININTNDGQQIKSISVLNDALVIFKEDSIWYLRGEPLGSGTNTTIGNLSLVKVNSPVGSAGLRCVAKVDSVLFFMSRDGIYALQNNSVTLVSKDINGTFRQDMNLSSQQVSWMVYNPIQKKLLIGYPQSGSIVANKIICYDTLQKKFTVWDDMPGAWAINFRFSNTDQVVMADPIKGNIYVLFQGYADIAGYNGIVGGSTPTTLNDNTANWLTNQFVDTRVQVGLGSSIVYTAVVTSNTATTLTFASWTNGPPPAGIPYTIGGYSSYWTSRIFSYEDPGMRKRYKYVDYFTDSEGNYALQNGVAINFATLSYNLPPLPLFTGSVTWDQPGVTWDQPGVYYDSRQSLFRRQSVPGQGHFIQIMFGNFNANQPWRVFEYQFDYKLKKESPN